MAVDYFGRTAGVAKRGEDFPYSEHVALTTPEDIQKDVAAAVAQLRPQVHKGSTSAGEGSPSLAEVFSVGFCFGGRHSWLAAASGHGLAGAIGFYGRPGRGRDGSPGPIERAGEITAPILALMGGADQAIPAGDIAAFNAALADAGVEHEIVTYEGAPHSFFDRKQEQFADASQDAWNRVLGFIARHGGSENVLF